MWSFTFLIAFLGISNGVIISKEASALIDRLNVLKSEIVMDKAEIKYLRDIKDGRQYAASNYYDDEYLDVDTLDGLQPKLQFTGKETKKALSAASKVALRSNKIKEWMHQYGWNHWGIDMDDRDGRDNHVLNKYEMMTLYHYTDTKGKLLIMEGCRKINAGEALPCHGGLKWFTYKVFGAGAYFAEDPQSGYCKAPLGFQGRTVKGLDSFIIVARVMVGKHLTIHPGNKYTMDGHEISGGDKVMDVKDTDSIDGRVMDRIGCDSGYVPDCSHEYGNPGAFGPEWIIYHRDLHKIIEIIGPINGREYVNCDKVPYGEYQKHRQYDSLVKNHFSKYIVTGLKFKVHSGKEALKRGVGYEEENERMPAQFKPEPMPIEPKHEPMPIGGNPIN